MQITAVLTVLLYKCINGLHMHFFRNKLGNDMIDCLYLGAQVITLHGVLPSKHNADQFSVCQLFTY